MAFGRNLTPAEIVDQALHFRRLEPVDHAVFMGMGEPMLNFDSVRDAAAILDVAAGPEPGDPYAAPTPERPYRVEAGADPGRLRIGLLAGVNDRVEQARALAALLDPKVFKVNLIPYNPTGMFAGSTPKAIAAFKDVLDRARLPATVRLTRGRDIAAACGQLAAEPKPRRRARAHATT
jgi:23S rRNA (adenine2503-C2)-methyltransferase